MHDPWTTNYDVGYEYWLMTEAKKRNPDMYVFAWGECVWYWHLLVDAQSCFSPS